MSTTLPPNCVETDSFLVELAYGEEGAVPASAKQHLATCDRCQAELRALQGVREAAATLPMEEPSPQLDSNIFAALDSHFAGQPVDLHLTLPDPQPVPARPKMTVLQGGADRSPAPENRKTTPKRRRIWGPLAAAASIALVGGSTWLVSRDQSPEAAFTRAKQEAQQVAAAPHEQDLKNSPAQDAIAQKPTDELSKKERDNAAPADKIVADEKQLAEKKAEAPAPMKAKDSSFFPKRPAAGSGGDMPPVDAPTHNALGGLSSGTSAGAGASSRGPVVPDAKPMALMPAAPVVSREAEVPAPPPPPAATAKTAPKAMVVAKEESSEYRSPASAAEMNDAATAPAPAAMAPDTEVYALQKSKADASTRSDDLRQAKRAATTERRETTTLEEATVWKHRLNEGREALKRGDWKWAENQFASVLQFKGVPAAIRREALEGRITALDQLNRTAEADAVADVLSHEFPSSTLRARAKSAAPAEPAGKADTTGK